MWGKKYKNPSKMFGGEFRKNIHLDSLLCRSQIGNRNSSISKHKIFNDNAKKLYRRGQMSSKYCGAEPYKQGTNDENIRKQIQISWDPN